MLYTNQAIDNWLTITKTHTIHNSTHGHIDVVEFRAFLGILYLRALMGFSKKRISSLWNKKHCKESLFRATMSPDRFRFLAAGLRFDNKNTRPSRWEKDRFCAMRELFDMFFFFNVPIFSVQGTILPSTRHSTRPEDISDLGNTIRISLQNTGCYFDQSMQCGSHSPIPACRIVVSQRI